MRVPSAFYRHRLLKTLILLRQIVFLSVLPIRKTLTDFDGSLLTSIAMGPWMATTEMKLRLWANGDTLDAVRVVKLGSLRFSGLECRVIPVNGGDTSS